MSEKNLHKPRVLLSLLSFALTLFMAIMVLVTTLIILLAELLGKAWLAALIVTVALITVAWLIYIGYARRAIEYIDSRLNTIYSVAWAAQNGYEVIRSTALRILGIFSGH